MQYRLLGSTGVKVSYIALGTYTFGAEADTATSKNMYAYCRDIGINLFDCADAYSNGKAEEILGQCIKTERDKVIITSKVYFPLNDDINSGGLSRANILRSVNGSLQRLGTDYIDIYFMHKFDVNTALEDSLQTMAALVAQGKILYLGLSNFAAWQIMKAIGISALHDFCKVSCVQPMYSLIKRQAEVEIFPLAEAEDLGVLAYSPLGAGMLTGKYTAQNSGNLGRITDNQRYAQRYSGELLRNIASDFVEFSRNIAVAPAALAAAWAAYHPAVTSILLGARNLSQLQESLNCLEINMHKDLWDEISSLSYTPAPATDRTEEQGKK